ncbi:hypothetical protein CspeluHIS016_0113890 [Cutaneotrichosporon spelunceum]|uniref:Double-strand break repair protein n=1 Tax=Cutaneotrichosporon spelunceum TaxID=1672016 RepID=A0AAD3YA92_9TREE|nr:hypothetical protein CspeluHIS016_0113890 [Cutaneotrichosporon spelunceum]
MVSDGNRSHLAAEPPPSIPQPDQDNCFRILIATDNHLGYAEKDPVRGQDAINTFREILEIARDQDVDFILLAGDLFHENRPSRTCLHQTIALLRQYTFGDKPVSFELLSDPMDGAAPGYDFPAVNYEDSNLNVGIPVFSIHGNHDDPQGTGPEGALCALDVLSVAGVLNYFGKVDLPSGQSNSSNQSSEGDTVNIRPILLRKGSTNLGLHGVGNIKDIRFHYQLRSNGVKMFMPRDGDGGIAADDWFNLLLIHQNRVKHGPQQAVPEGMFDDSIKLVLWGHEHDCRIWPEQVEGKPYFISQPGSSVATSLAHGEALPKHVGILSVQGDKFQIAEMPLKTVRPFEIDELELIQEAERDDSKMNLDDKDTISAVLREKVEELISKARLNWEATHDAGAEEMMLPLIRLRVETTGAKEMTNPVRFGQDFIGRVANPRDILQYYRKKVATRKTVNNPDRPEDVVMDDEEDEDPAAMTTSDRLAKIRMAKLVKQYLNAQNLDLLVEDGLEEAVMRFVDKDDKDAIKDFVHESLKTVGKSAPVHAMVVNDEEDMAEFMARAKEQANEQWAVNPLPEEPKKARKSDIDSMAEDSMLEQSEEDIPPPKGGRGAKGKATVTRSKKGSTRASASNARQKLFDLGSEDSDALDGDDVSSEDRSRSPAKARRKAPTRTNSSGQTGRGTANKTAATGPKAAPKTTRRTRAAASSLSQPRQTQLSFSKGRGSKLVDSDSN